jgi:hypothetical protein
MCDWTLGTFGFSPKRPYGHLLSSSRFFSYACHEAFHFLLSRLFDTVELAPQVVGSDHALSRELLLLVVGHVIDKVFGKVIGMQAHHPHHVASALDTSE